MSQEDKIELQRARELSEKFHGTDSEVVELSERERHLPRFAVKVGKVHDISYQPGRKSKLAGTIYEHQAGDYGLGQKGKKKPVLLATPDGKPVMVAGESDMKLESRGLVG